jgi:hypothetical protein
LGAQDAIPIENTDKTITIASNNEILRDALRPIFCDSKFLVLLFILASIPSLYSFPSQQTKRAVATIFSIIQNRYAVVQPFWRICNAKV